MFSQVDFQGLQAFLDTQEYWTDASTVYSEFGCKVLKGGVCEAKLEPGS